MGPPVCKCLLVLCVCVVFDRGRLCVGGGTVSSVIKKVQGWQCYPGGVSSRQQGSVPCLVAALLLPRVLTGAYGGQP